MCEDLQVPIAADKTEWANTWVIFLGMLLDRVHHILSIPVKKRDRALNLLQNLLVKKKAMVKELHSIAGLLNFLNRAFTHRMYSKFVGIVKGTGGDMRQVNLESKKVLPKQHHHVTLDREFKADCRVWVQFLQSETNATCDPFIDMTRELTADVLNFYTDAAKGLQLGFGCVFGSCWMYGQ